MKLPHGVSCHAPDTLSPIPCYVSGPRVRLCLFEWCRFVRVFAEEYEASFRAEFEAAGISYEHRLIDDMVAQVWAYGLMGRGRGGK